MYKKKTIDVFTDGACLEASKSGGWGAVFNPGDGVSLKLSGGKRNATEKQMELFAVIESLKHIFAHFKEIESVQLYTDSAYVIRGVGRLDSLSNGESAHGYAPCYCKENHRDWETLRSLIDEIEVKFIWLQERSKYKEQEQCRQLAEQEVQALHKEKRTGL